MRAVEDNKSRISKFKTSRQLHTAALESASKDKLRALYQSIHDKFEYANEFNQSQANLLEEFFIMGEDLSQFSLEDITEEPSRVPARNLFMLRDKNLMSTCDKRKVAT